MSVLELLASAPGTGKTTHCIELFRNRILTSKGGIDSRSFFILPSREHAERIQNLVLKKGVEGLFNAHILTIQDLADCLPGLSGAGRPTESIRRSILSEILSGAESESVYEYFRQSLGLRGFHELMLEAIREFKSGLLSIPDFERRAQPLLKDPVFRSKFRDFSILLKRYDAKLLEWGLAEPEDELARLGSLDDKSRRPELVIFDGFYHFTRSQRKLLSLVSSWAEHTVVTLTTDPLHAGARALFDYPERTRRFLMETGFREVPGFSENHRVSDPALRHLSVNLFSPEPAEYAGPSPVTVLAAPSGRVEIERVAREIRRLYREKNYHFSDVCVILRAVSGHRALIESVFSEYGVPVEIHERRRLTESGLAMALCRFLRLVADDWKREDVLYLAKSSYFRGLFPPGEALELERVALRENLVQGREGWRVLVESQKFPAGIGEFLGHLLEQDGRLRTASGPHVFGSFTDAYLKTLRRAMDPAGIDAAAVRSIASILAAGRRRYSDGRGPFRTELYVAEVLAAIENGLLSLKSRGRNRVQVYDAVMALPKEYKVVFIANLLEKAFPQAVTEDPLFKDSERNVLNGKDPFLDERAWRLSGERYFFYMALTRAREKIYLTYSTHDADGKPALASFFIDEVSRCFGQGALRRVEKSAASFLPGPDEWESAADVARGAARAASDGGSGRAFAEAIAASRKAPAALSKILTRALAGPSVGFRDPRVHEALAAFGGPFSASGLEAFLTCPFRHFAEHLLRLKGPLEGREQALMGTLLHETLREYFEKLPEKDRESGKYLRDSLGMEKELEVIFTRRFEKGPFRGEPLYRQVAWRESMLRMLRRYVGLEVELAGGGMVPSRFEYEFGKGKTECLRIPDPAGEILLKGSIDRLDTDPSGRKAVVIDYKRSSRNLRDKLRKGDEIQLPLYLLAVRGLLGLEPAGLEHRILKTGKREAAELTPGELENLLAETEERIRQAVRRIRSGEITVEPKDCAFCEFDAVCRVDVKKERGRDV